MTRPNPADFLDEWLASSPLRPSTRAEYRRDVLAWLTWCSAIDPPADPWQIGPGDVDPWLWAKRVEDRAADPHASERSHDRRVTALTQYYLAAQQRGVLHHSPDLSGLRYGHDRDGAEPVRRLDAQQREAFVAAVGAWGPEQSRHHHRDRLLCRLLLDGLRPHQTTLLDIRNLTEQPDGSYDVRIPDNHDGPGRLLTLTPLTGAALADYLPHRTPRPGVHTLLISRTGRPLYSRFPNELVRDIAATNTYLARYTHILTADAVAHSAP